MTGDGALGEAGFECDHFAGHSLATFAEVAELVSRA